MERIIKDENEWIFLADVLAKAITPGLRLYLSGELGVGKTTLVRCLLRQLTVLDVVKSPTYALVETYTVKNTLIHHFDLYRLQSAQELHYVGLEDYFSDDAIVIVEWPEKGLGVLLEADIFCTLSYHECGRSITCVAHSTRGKRVLEQVG